MAISSKVLISVKHLVKEYNHGTVHALDGCDLDIHKGEVVAIIGPSGSGKSTLLRSLNLLEDPTSGAIYFDGVDLASKQLRRMQQSNAGSAGEAVSRNEIDAARARLEMAQARRESARQAGSLLRAGARAEDIAEASAQTDAARAQLDLLRRTLEDTRLLAPSSGVIRSRLQDVGDLTTPQKPVYALALNDAKWVRVYVPEPALGRVREGMAAQIRIDSAPQQPLAGRVGYIASVAEFTPKTVQTEELRSALVYEVRVHAQDPQDQLRLGMPATVTIDLAGAPRVAASGQ